MNLCDLNRGNYICEKYRKLKQTKTKQLQKTGTFDISIHCLLKKYDIIN